MPWSLLLQSSLLTIPPILTNSPALVDYNYLVTGLLLLSAFFVISNKKNILSIRHTLTMVLLFKMLRRVSDFRINDIAHPSKLSILCLLPACLLVSRSTLLHVLWSNTGQHLVTSSQMSFIGLLVFASVPSVWNLRSTSDMKSRKFLQLEVL